MDEDGAVAAPTGMKDADRTIEDEADRMAGDEEDGTTGKTQCLDQTWISTMSAPGAGDIGKAATSEPGMGLWQVGQCALEVH